MSNPDALSPRTSGSAPAGATLMTSTPCETAASCARSPRPERTRSKMASLISESPRQDRVTFVCYLVLQLHDAVDHHLGTRRASRDVDVDRDDPVDAEHR